MSADHPAPDALLERLAIEELLSRYPFLVDRGRFAELSTLFTPDGIMDGPVGGPAVGQRDIEEFFRHSATKPVAGRAPKLMRHNITSQRIELNDDQAASADSYFLAVSDVGLDHWGRYRDLLVKTDGVWRFGKRQLTVDGFADGSWWEQNIAGAAS